MAFPPFGLLISEHGCSELPGRSGRVAPGRRNGDKAVGAVLGIDVKETGVTSDQSLRIVRGGPSDLNETAVGRHFFKRQQAGRSDEEKFIGEAHADAALQWMSQFTKEVSARGLSS